MDEPDITPSHGDPERLWTVDDVAHYLGIHAKRVLEIPGLPRVKFSTRRIRFRPAAVRAWVEHQEAA